MAYVYLIHFDEPYIGKQAASGNRQVVARHYLGKAAETIVHHALSG